MRLLDFISGGRPQDRFAKAIERELVRLAPYLPCRYEPAAFALHLGKDSRTTTVELADLDRVYRACSRGERAQLLRDQALAIMRGDNDSLGYAAARSRLKPVVRNRTFILHADIGDAGRGGLAWRPLPEPLGVVLAVDSALSMSFVTLAKLQAWGVDFDTALSAAIDNLRAAGPAEFGRHEPGFYVSTYGDFLDGSRLLSPDLFASLDIKGDPVAVVASANCMTVCGAEDEAALTAMAQFVGDAITHQGMPITCTPVVLRDGEWRTFAVDAARQPLWASLLAKEAI